jgi:hypothetical protein
VLAAQHRLVFSQDAKNVGLSQDSIHVATLPSFDSNGYSQPAVSGGTEALSVAAAAVACALPTTRKRGLAGNVTRIKPPMCITRSDSDFVADCRDEVLPLAAANSEQKGIPGDFADRTIQISERAAAVSHSP